MHTILSPKQFTWKGARDTTENMQPPRAPLVQTLQKAAQGTVMFSCTAPSCTVKQPCPKARGRNGKQPKLRFSCSSSKRWNFTSDTILRLCFLSVISILYSAITLAGRTKYLYQSAWDKVHRLWIFLPISTRHQQEVYAKCCLAFPVLAGYSQLQHAFWSCSIISYPFKHYLYWKVIWKKYKNPMYFVSTSFIPNQRPGK